MSSETCQLRLACPAAAGYFPPVKGGALDIVCILPSEELQYCINTFEIGYEGVYDCEEC